MRLESLAVEVRPRSHWECCDLGFLMIRKWAIQVYLPLAIVMLGVILPILPFAAKRTWLPFFLLWWLKPIWQRIPLLVLSRAMFGEQLSLASTLRAFPATMRTNLILPLTFLRFSPNRVVTHAVAMLEGEKGRPRRRRQAFLARQVWFINFSIVGLFLLFEWATIVLGIYAFVQLMVPDEMRHHVFSTLPENVSDLGIGAAYFCAVLIIEPIFAAVGFALYLNCRTLTEGWDLELAFKRIALKLQKPVKAAAIIACALLCMLVTARPVCAQEESAHFPFDNIQPNQEEQTQPPKDEKTVYAKDAVGEVLAGSDFMGKETKKTWRLKKFKNEAAKPQRELNPRWEWLKDVLSFIFGSVFRVVILLVLLVLLSLLIYNVVMFTKNRKPPLRLEKKKSGTPEKATTLPTPEELPTHIVASATNAWTQGKHRLALSLLYRGAIRQVAPRCQPPIPLHATEQECLLLVKPHLHAEAWAFMQQLTGIWLNLAYAHRPVTHDQFEALCRAYPILEGRHV